MTNPLSLFLDLVLFAPLASRKHSTYCNLLASVPLLYLTSGPRSCESDRVHGALKVHQELESGAIETRCGQEKACCPP